MAVISKSISGVMGISYEKEREIVVQDTVAPHRLENLCLYGVSKTHVISAYLPPFKTGDVCALVFVKIEGVGVHVIDAEIYHRDDDEWNSVRYQVAAELARSAIDFAPENAVRKFNFAVGLDPEPALSRRVVLALYRAAVLNLFLRTDKFVFIMKKMKKILLVFVLPFLFLGCDDVKEDDPNSLPYVDVSEFRSGTSIEFPKKTTALEIYSVMCGKYGLGSHAVSGEYSHTESATLNGKEFSDTITKNITKVEIYRTDGEISHSFHSDFTCDDGSKIEFYYKWQQWNTNDCHNNELDGEIRIN